MTNKRKAKIQKIIFSVVLLFCFACAGGYAGAFLIKFEDKIGHALAIWQVFSVLAIVMLLAFLLYYASICMHEIGHVIFGIATGYEFISVRFGKLMIAKSEGKLKFYKYDLSGTGGQAIMAPPKNKDGKDIPVVLYNIGGLIVNLSTVLVCICLAFLVNNNIYAGSFFILFAIISFACFITNAIPLSEVGTDGANAIILHKSPEARKAFANSLIITRMLGDGKPVNDCPEELFAFDMNTALNNPLITSQAVNRYNYLMSLKNFEEAKKLGNYIVNNAKSINWIHEAILKSDLIFIAAVIDGDIETAKAIYEKEKKDLSKIATMISYQRTMYAYYSLCEVNEKKAADSKKSFETLTKHYPYKEDLRIEEEYMKMVEQRKNESNV